MRSRAYLIDSAMFVSLVTVLVAAPLVLGQFGQFGQIQRKPGACPPYPNVGICHFSCYVDQHCEGSQKCCRTACGGTFCINPVTAPVSRVVEKPGSCPANTGPWVCTSRCGQDSDCRGKKKCCRNRCGAKACLTPEEDVENEIPL